MKVTFKEELPFILKPGTLGGYVENCRGMYKFVDGGFSQMLKQSEYEKVMEANINQQAERPAKQEHEEKEKPAKSKKA